MSKTTKIITSSEPTSLGRPALTPEARQQQLVALAMDMAEEQLRNRTASSQVLTTFIKFGTVQAELELEKIRRETKVLEAKAEAYESAKRIEELYANALSAMRKYGGQSSDE